MAVVPFDSEEGLSLLGELVRLTAPPAGEEEILHQGIALAGRSLGASAGAIILHRQPGTPAATWGSGSIQEMVAVAFRTVISLVLVEVTGESAPSRVALPLPGRTEPIGALVLEKPLRWGPAARAFARSAAQLLASSIESARTIRQSHLQGELLASRNVELITLHELVARLQELAGEEEMLQATLDMVLERMGLAAGWIFLREPQKGELGLAASRGVSEAFVRQARESGVGTCLCQEVFASGERMLARNTVECPRLPDLVCGTESITHACIPLKFQRGILGVMNIANRPGQLFSAQELQFLEIIGNQVCLAVDRARTTHAEMRRNDEARALSSLARAIGGSLDQDRVLAAVGEYARELLAADRCAILLGETTSQPLLFAYLSGPPFEGLEVGQPVDLVALGSRAFVEALQQRKTLVVQDALHDPRANAELAARWSVGSQILVPLIAHDRLEGVLAVVRAVASAWTQDDVALADALAGQAAVALDNARLYREVQENLRKLQDAQYGIMRAERLAAVGTLASSLAHEVRNPLNSISLGLVLLTRRLRRLEGPAREELGAIVETAHREIARLNDLVEEFLSLSSLDRLSLAEADLRELVREVVDLMAPSAREKAVVIRSALSRRLPRVRIDREKIKQVFINLVRNAIEAMPRGGTLGVSAKGTEDSIVIRLSDTGVGIPPGLDVFDFFLTTKRGGTGLGLPISRRIVEVHGGSLTYESEPGRGTVFSVTLKAEKAEAEGARRG